MKKPDPTNMVKILNESEQIGGSYIKRILEALLLRTRFIYGYIEILHAIFICKCLKNNKKDKTMTTLERRQVLYHKGEEKLERELDVVNLLRSIRQLRLMAQVLLGPQERMLLKFQRKNVIETTSSSSDSDHYKEDTVKLLNSKKDLVKLQ